MIIETTNLDIRPVAEALARAAAHGSRQALLVEELILGRIYISYKELGYKYRWTQYGAANLGSQSYMALKKRLQASGFELRRTKEQIPLVGNRYRVEEFVELAYTGEVKTVRSTVQTRKDSTNDRRTVPTGADRGRFTG